MQESDGHVLPSVYLISVQRLCSKRKKRLANGALIGGMFSIHRSKESTALRRVRSSFEANVVLVIKKSCVEYADEEE